MKKEKINLQHSHIQNYQTLLYAAQKFAIKAMVLRDAMP
jgi:hypothetical protein